MMRMMKFLLVLVSLSACTGLPDKVQPVENFEIERYLGTWFEIARLDHRFERGLEQVSAEYSLREDGVIRVVNRGFDPRRSEWKQVEGRARFVGSPDIGRLKVSFFGPFYGSYTVFELDSDEYGYALVSGPTNDYLWILSRQPSMDSNTLDRLLSRASAAGFDTDALIFPSQQVSP